MHQALLLVLVLIAKSQTIAQEVAKLDEGAGGAIVLLLDRFTARTKRSLTQLRGKPEIEQAERAARLSRAA